MEVEEIVVDANNMYVQSLIKVINDFLLEEASGCLSSEDRLRDKIEKLKSIFSDERKKMVIRGQAPLFGHPTSDKYKLILAN